MGGKTSQSTQTQTIPAQVLAQYQSVNNQAQQTAQQPFQTYSTNPAAFVAPLNDTQNAGIAGTNAAAGLAQPYYAQATSTLQDAQNATQPYYASAEQNITGAQGAAAPLQGQAASGFSSALAGAQPYNAGATGLALAGAQAVNPTDLSGADISKYLSPYLSTVLGSESALLNQNNQQQQIGQLGNAITSGAFGGDRAGIAAANLEQQQNLGNANIYSGILNAGYTNALSTAQQQQQLGLSAAQANRAALSGAAGQIQSIGQQGYEQGTGTAGAQAALGQQEFGQGITASGAQSGLGQDVYNTGAATSAALAGLGSGAQAAALQGAQAQLAAGQVQQQTQQAGDTALYNQFLQQQSYPFQVSQFLANIAEGTGSLSGSTTTTTQPGSLLSDRRAKEGIEPIGKTYDGQTIFKYRYKGDKTTQIGLMAQDVEKKHPKAVGLAGGLKTVNYDEATRDAAERGHFRKGGLVPANDGYAVGGAPGFDPQIMQQILQNGQGMYGPYASALGGGPASPASGPYGGVARVPAANVPVGQLKAPGALPARPSGLQQANDIASFASNAAKGADWIKGQLPKDQTTASDVAPDQYLAANDAVAPDLSTDVPDFGLKRGGRAKRYADGGMPYSYDGGLALSIPDEESHASLPTPGQLPKQASTGDDLADIAKIAQTAAMFMAHGGLARARFASGGSPYDPSQDGYDPSSVPDNDPGSVGGLLSSLGHMFQFSDKPSPDMTPGADWTGSAGNMSNSVSHQDMTDLLAGKKPADVPRALARSPGLGGAGRHKDSWSAGPPADFGSDPLDVTTAQPAQINADIAAPPPAASPGLSAAAPDASAVTPTGQGPVAGLGSGASDVVHAIASKVAPKGGYLDRLFSGDEQTLVPFLAGLGAFASAPTRNVGTALAQGLSVGAQTYPKIQSQQAELARTQAATDVEKATAAQRQAQTGLTQTQSYEALQHAAPPGYQLVPGASPDGKQFTVNGQPYHYAVQTNLTDFGQGASAAATAPKANAAPSTLAPSADTDAAMQSSYKVDPSRPGVANRAQALAMNPALAPLDEAAQKSVQERVGNLGDADTTRRQLLQMAQSTADLTKGTLTGQGYGSALREKYANIYNTAANMMGVPSDPTVTGDLTSHQILDKLKTLSASNMANQNNEKAASIAHGISAVLPSGDLTPQAAQEIISQMLVQNQQRPDLSQYNQNFVNRYGLSVGVENAFRNDTAPVYGREQKALSTLMASPKFSDISNAILNAPPELRAQRAQQLDAYYKAPGLHRYLTGGQ